MKSFAEILTVGGKTNSLGRSNEVIDAVLRDQTQLKQLYACVYDDNAWVRMRAADALEKVCREHPDWLLPYIDRSIAELNPVSQPSVLWHLAQIYRQVDLTASQKQKVIVWLQKLLSSIDCDWIVAANAMTTLVQFSVDGSVPRSQTIKLLEIQQHHKSQAVVRRAAKLLQELK